jgi:hypothetical protein
MTIVKTTVQTTGTDNATTGQLVARVKQLVAIMASLVEKGKRSQDVVQSDWAALGDLVDIASFERVGPFHDAMDWTAYTTMLTQWVNQSEGWNPVVLRMAQAPGLVFAQCEEMITRGETVSPFYSLSMYVFNDAMKITRIEVYMQQA